MYYHMFTKSLYTFSKFALRNTYANLSFKPALRDISVLALARINIIISVYNKYCYVQVKL